MKVKLPSVRFTVSLYSTVAPLDIFPVRFVVIVASPSCADAVQAAAPTSSKRIKV